MKANRHYGFEPRAGCPPPRRRRYRARKPGGGVLRETGFEPATSTLANFSCLSIQYFQWVKVANRGQTRPKSGSRGSLWQPIIRPATSQSYVRLMLSGRLSLFLSGSARPPTIDTRTMRPIKLSAQRKTRGPIFVDKRTSVYYKPPQPTDRSAPPNARTLNSGQVEHEICTKDEETHHEDDSSSILR